MFLVYNPKKDRIQLLSEYDFRYNLYKRDNVKIIRAVDADEEIRVSRVELRLDLYKYLEQQQLKLNKAKEEIIKRKRIIKHTEKLLDEAEDWQMQHGKDGLKKKQLETSSPKKDTSSVLSPLDGVSAA